MEKRIKENIKKIADTYGYEPQSRQCIEEMAELTQAINKFWRKCGNGQPTEKEMDACRKNLIEELADVQIMIWQMAYLLGVDTMPDITRKIDRQIKRIEDKG